MHRQLPKVANRDLNAVINILRLLERTRRQRGDRRTQSPWQRRRRKGGGRKVLQIL